MEEKLTGMEWKRNGNGMESKWKMEQRQKEKVCYRNEQKSKRTDLKQTRFIQNGMEMEWKENGNGMEKYQQKISMQNGMEMERKWNGNGMEKNYYPNLEVKLNGVEWKRNGNGMEKLQQQVMEKIDFGNGMEWKWKWKWNCQ